MTEEILTSLKLYLDCQRAKGHHFYLHYSSLIFRIISSDPHPLNDTPPDLFCRGCWIQFVFERLPNLEDIWEDTGLYEVRRPSNYTLTLRFIESEESLAVVWNFREERFPMGC